MTFAKRAPSSGQQTKYQKTLRKKGTLMYRNIHQYSGPLTPCLRRDGVNMRIVEDAHLTEDQKSRREEAWVQYRQHFDHARAGVEPDESSEFARQLLSWAGAPAEAEEHWTIRGLGSASRSRSSSDASTRIRWPVAATEPLDQLPEDPNRVYRGGDSRLGIIGPDEYEMARMRSHSLATVDRDGFKTPTLTRPSHLIPGADAQHRVTSTPHVTNAFPAGRSLTDSRGASSEAKNGAERW